MRETELSRRQLEILAALLHEQRIGCPDSDWPEDTAADHRADAEALAAAGVTLAPDRPGVLDDSIEGNLQRVDALRVLELALASQGVPDVNAPSLLRDVEEGGYTLRLTTSDERRRRNER